VQGPRVVPVADPAGARIGRAAVLGRPIAHSLSPVLHRAAYAALGLDWRYEAIECGVADLPAVLARRADWAGFSCTMPLKRALLDVAAHVSERAAAIGSANTLLPGPDGWTADNTDAPGLLAALREAGVRPASATLLGAGGTAQAALAALRPLGVDSCAVLVRDIGRTGELQSAAERLGVRVDVRALTDGDPAWDVDLLVSTLPAGAADPFAARPWRPAQVVVDVGYAPWPTRLAAAAGERGATVVGGAAMLLHQAALQVELMTGVPAPLPAMRAALDASRAPRPA
jgi:shikimate dehydrogenase